MQQTDLQSRTVIVTGGSQGLGAAISTAFADKGAQTIVHYRSNLEAADAVVAGIREKGGEAIALPGHLDRVSDVTSAPIY